MFQFQQVIIREYVCTSLKLLNYLKNTEFKILKIIPVVVAAKHVAGIRGDPCEIETCQSVFYVCLCILTLKSAF